MDDVRYVVGRGTKQERMAVGACAHRYVAHYSVPAENGQMLFGSVEMGRPAPLVSHELYRDTYRLLRELTPVIERHHARKVLPDQFRITQIEPLG